MKTALTPFTIALEQEFKEEQKFKYAISFEESRYYDIAIGRFKEALSDPENTRIDSVYFLWLFELVQCHFEYSVYAKVSLNDEELAKKHLSFATEYGYLCLEYGSQSCGCFESKNPFIIMNKAVFMMSNLLLTHQIDRFNLIGKHLINSLNGEGCIIKKGYAKATVSWFVLKLYSLYANQAITLHKLLQPKESYPYDEVLAHWDSNSLNDVTKYVELLCDTHLIQAKTDYAIHLEEEFDSLKYRELFIVGLYTLPYEILSWLRIRELKGLKNPTQFMHPLMNTPLVKMFLELAIPLAKPTELPYAKELLITLKKGCPQIVEKEQSY